VDIPGLIGVVSGVIGIVQGFVWVRGLLKKPKVIRSARRMLEKVSPFEKNATKSPILGLLSASARRLRLLLVDKRNGGNLISLRVSQSRLASKKNVVPA